MIQKYRKNIRLPYYDYRSAGLYFITVCTRYRRDLFGRINDGVMHLNEAGQMVSDAWCILPEKFVAVSLHEHIVMPNHFHGILEISDASTVSIGDIVGAFKSVTTNRYIAGVKHEGMGSVRETFMAEKLL